MKIRSIRYPEEGEQRMKEIVNRSNTRATGKYPSWKMGRFMQWETVDHLKAFRSLDADSKVHSFEEQPLLIEYESGGFLHIERPHILVVTGHQKELWTIKKSLETFNRIQQAEQEELSLHLLRHGYLRKTVMAETLEEEPRMGNQMKLLRLGRCQVSSLEREAIRHFFMKRSGVMTWGEILGAEVGPIGKNIICRLVLEGLVHFDITKFWTNLTTFYWVNGGSNLMGVEFQ